MAEKFGFLSYGHDDKAAVFPLAEWIEKRGLKLWYSRFMEPGSYEDQITDRIEKCSVVIAIITEAGAGPKSSGWVRRELMEANDAGRVIFPCIIGDFKLGQELRRVIETKHSVKAARIQDLIHDENFRHCIDALIRSDNSDDEADSFTRDWARQSQESVANWYRAGAGPGGEPPSYADQALALAIASLPDVPADLVTLAADDLKLDIEQNLRELTKRELKEQPRSIGTESLSERLERVCAERVRISDVESDRPYDVIRFTKSRWDYDLLEHVWTEREDVRRHYVDWLAKVVTQPETHEFGRFAAQTIGVLARENLKSINIMVLANWLQSSDEDRLRKMVPVISDVLTAAVEERGNVNEVKRLLLNLAKQRQSGGGERFSGQQAALMLVLGQVGLRRPALAIEILKKLGWNIFDDRNFRIVIRSPAFYGSQTLEDANVDARPEDEEGAADTGGEATAAEKGSGDQDTDEIDPDDTDTGDTEGTEASDARAEDGTDPDQKDVSQDGDDGAGDDTETEALASAALPAMEFIAALADWANEPIKARNRKEQEEGKLKRQVPLAALLLIFGGMPYLNRRKSNRLTLEEMMRIATRWDSELLDRIVAGLRRAGMATKYRGNRSPYFAQHYFPPQHLSNVFHGFARERWLESIGKGLDPEDRPDEGDAVRGRSAAGICRARFTPRSTGRTRRRQDPAVLPMSSLVGWGVF